MRARRIIDRSTNPLPRSSDIIKADTQLAYRILHRPHDLSSKSQTSISFSTAQIIAADETDLPAKTHPAVPASANSRARAATVALTPAESPRPGPYSSSLHPATCCKDWRPTVVS